MKNFKSIFLFFLLLVFPLFTNTALGEELSKPISIESLYFDSTQDPKLTQNEKIALELVREWSADSTKAVKPTIGADGSIQFLFGASQPGIICAVTHITDVQLEPGERVNSLHYGDTARWIIEPAITGFGGTEVQHLIIKPKDVGLETSLVVTTDRRTYHMRLKSTQKQYMTKVSFIYPDNIMAKWDTLKAKSVARIQRDTIPETNEYIGKLDFEYDIDGQAKWKPLRVYNDGKKTIIQMPQTMKQAEAPSLLVVQKEGGLFSDPVTVMVNYRIHKSRYIIDRIFDKAILIVGVGGDQEKITITRDGI